jgi:Pvc16 N-terminal domain
MSNSLAVATVTTALAAIVRSAAQTIVPGADVLTERPDANPPAQPRVRLFLYQVTPNGSLRNHDLPTRSAEGNLVTRPVAALDLHYLLAFYGNENELEPQRMLGAVARDLHSKPALMRQMINDAVASQAFLNGSNLADAVEQVKFTPLSLTLDELSKIWSVFFQTPYALSVAYQATAVLIDSEESAPASQPVLTRGQDDRGADVLLGPFPILESIHIGEGGNEDERLRQPSYPAVRLGAIMTLRGRNLGGDKVSLSFAHPRLSTLKVIDVPDANRTATQMTVAIQLNAATPPEWVAGIYSLTVVIQRGDKKHNSNELPVSFAPQITKIEPPNPVQRDGQGKIILTVTCAPGVMLTKPTAGQSAQLAQRVVLLLADREVGAQLPPLPAPPPNATDKIDFVIENAPVVKDALVRLRIDGVDSLPFKMSGKPPKPVFDDAQRVTVT